VTTATAITVRFLPPICSVPTVRAFSSAGTSTETMTTSPMEEEAVKESPPPLVRTIQRPNLPFRYYDDDDSNTNEATSLPTLDLSELSQQISVTYQQKQNMYEISRNIQNSIQQIRTHIGTDVAQREIQQLLDTYSNLSSTNNHDNGDPSNSVDVAVLTHDKATNRVPRMANLSYTVEDIIRTISYQHFLQTGRVVVPPPYVTDEEYLCGAIMGLCSDLQHYGLGRATVRDIDSVQMACQVVTACMEYLLSFDFRNGPMRRKYDGCKYSLKALETFLYELAVTSPAPSTTTSNPTGTDPPSLVLGDILPMKELIALKEQIEFRDELRETLIKKCRDGQKLAKQCIFALHRNHTDQMTPQTLLQQCSKYIQEDLFPIVQEEPPLRYGSFASVLEEYVEAKLFYTWLHGRDPNSVSSIPIGSTESSPAKAHAVSGIILVPQDFMMDEFIQLQPEEYIGGLCDLTGEIGRFAVQRGTVRDVASIKQCLYSNTIIFNAIQSMDRISSSNGGGGGGGSPKKLDTVRNNVQKIERMLYEISLSEAAGHGRTIHTDVPYTEVDED
jgi:predicted translin family RNA/ssDNA-binding protein